MHAERHILVVEDNEAHAELISRAFEASAHGSCLHLAASLKEARALTEQHLPTLVLTDYRLPDGYGVDLAAMLRDVCPVIMMTSQGNEQVAVDAMKAGVRDYVVKSAEMFDELPRIAQRVMREWELIQDHRRMQEALAAREEEYRTLLENLPDAVSRYDRQGRTLYVNRVMLEKLQNASTEVVGKTPTELFGEQCRDYEAAISRVLANGEPEEIEVVHLEPSGRLATCLVRLVAERTVQGEVTGVLAIGRDITERKRMEDSLVLREAELQRKSEFQKTLLKGLDDAGLNLLVLEQGRIVYVLDKRLAQQFGFSDEVLARKPEFINAVHPDDQQRVMDLYQRRINGETASALYESGVLLANGERREYELAVSVVPGTEPVQVIVITRDITERKRVDQEYSTLLENLPGPVIRYDKAGRCRYLNRAAEEMLGHPVEQLLGKLPGEDGVAMVSSMVPFYRYSLQEVMATGQTTEFEFILDLKAPEEQAGYQIRMAPDRDVGGRVSGVVVIGWDISERRRMDLMLHKSRQDFVLLVENAPDPISRYDREARRIYVNAAFERMSGMPDSLLLHKRPDELPVGSPAVGEITAEAVRYVLTGGIATETEVSWELQDGTQRYFQIRFVPEFDHEGVISGVLSIAHDISMIRNYQRQLHNLAFFDPLTSLPNRSLFYDRMMQAITNSSRHSGRVAGLMLLDLDRFKAVNDSLGHAAGDSLLCQVGERLKKAVRDYDTVARLGGDEFAVILQDVRHDVDLGSIARKILTAFAEPFEVMGRSLNMTTSIGIVSCPGDSQDIDELMQFADSAMYHAKAQGKNCFQFYSIELTACATERLSLEASLRKAVKHEEFELHYQPKVDQGSGALVGAEALVRWHHPDLGMVPPIQFIPIAEDTGMIIEIGEWVLRNAFTAACGWNDGQERPLKIAVNLSARQFFVKNLIETVRSVLAETGCRPEWIELEITESLLLDGNATIRTTLETLRDMGFTIAIDDFGTGYSGLGYLSRFPIHTIKIDRSFIRDITTNQDSAVLVEAIVSMAHALRMQVVAEGVETREQAEHLHGIGCRLIQGYFFGKPMPKDEFDRYSSTVFQR